MHRIKGITDLLVDTVVETTKLVESTHRSVTDRTVRRIGVVEPLAEPAQQAAEVYGLASSAVYGSVRLVTRGVGRVGDAGWALAMAARGEPEGESDALATPVRSDAAGSAGWLADVAQTALNAAVGDFLQARSNPLDLGMSLRQQGRPVPLEPDALADAYPDATGKLCVFVHGLGTTEWSWSLFAEQIWGDPATCYGTKLFEELGYTPLYVRYNSGAHVSDNGERLAALLEALVEAYPHPVQEVVLVGHSMGGLVTRSAAHYGAARGTRWAEHLRHVICLGSPHLGAPLEKAGNVLSWLLRRFDTAGTQVPARLIDARSAGIKDLRFGYTVHDEWRGRDPDSLLEDNRHDVPLVDGVGYAVVAGTLTRDPKHPLGALLGDILVRLPSAAGHHPEPARHIPFPVRHVHGGMSHLHLANHPDVYAQLRALLAADPLPQRSFETNVR